MWTQPDDSQGNFIDPTTGQLKDTGIWRRANTRITDTDTFTDQLALTGKFNTGAFKHSFNVGAEYSKAESDKGSYTITDPNTKAIGGAVANGACSLGLAASNGWCTSTFNPNSNDRFLGTVTANKAVTTTTSESTSVYAPIS